MGTPADLCAIARDDRQVHCWSAFDGGEVQSSRQNGRALDLAMDASVACAQFEAGVVRCFGAGAESYGLDGDMWQGAALRQIGVSWSCGYGIDGEGRFVSWGRECTPPVLPERYLKVEVGWSPDFCVILEPEREFLCLDAIYGMEFRGPDDGTWSGLVDLSMHNGSLAFPVQVCAVRADGTLRCWTEAPDLLLTAESIFDQPRKGRWLPHDTRFRSVQFAGWQVCGITESGGVWCGPERNYDTVDDVPDDMLPPETLFEAPE